MRVLPLVLCGLLGCSALPPPTPDAGTAQDAGGVDASCPLEALLTPPDAASARGVELGRRTVTVLGQTRELVLLRLPTADGKSTFAIWAPPLASAGVQPAVLLTQPYDGIDWSTELVDTRWASACPTGSCLLPDTDGPDGGPTAGVIAYSLLTPEAWAQGAGAHLFQGVGVLGVFGRFYAGGSWWSSAQAMVAGLRFLSTQPSVDASRLGVMGGSLGGYEAFYAAAYAPAEARPRVVVPLYPPVDLAAEVRWATETGPGLATTATRKTQFAAFFDPYLRRLAVDTGPLASADYRCFDLQALVPRVSAEIFVAADDWDLLVDPKISRGLVTAFGARGHAVWYQHATPVDADSASLDHGPFDGQTAFPTFDTHAMTFLYLRLSGTAPVVVPYDKTALLAQFSAWKSQPQPQAAERLADLADARVTLVNVADGTATAGPDAMSTVLAAIWQVAVPPAQVQQYLRTVGLPP